MTNIKILGWVHVVLSGLLLALGLVLCAALFMSGDKESRAGAVILPLFGTMAVSLLIPGFVGGIGLLYLQPWARVLIIVLSLMHLFLFPIGTLLGGFGLWILLGSDAKAAFGDAAVRSIMAAAARLPAGTSPDPFMGMGGVVLAIAGVGAGFIVVIGAGFMISGDPAPVEISSAFYPAVGVLAVVLAFAVRAILRNPPRFSGGGARPTTPAQAAQIRREDEARRAYELDRTKTATCEHLRGVERAMRDDGIAVKLIVAPNVTAACRVDPDAFARRFELPAFAAYAEPQQYDRSVLDPPHAVIWCSACNSAIHVVHPQQAPPNLPVFPRGS